ncbi:energy-coupling factor ABC transporter ATP-binding protein [Eremococcus coleocola]|uniref:ABC transporter, ATP-binding protein n=1 Tax=Eremococcus coleocola ACS-139-V-Col8 TaxID=908337 RepID=E4KMP4_9LACT|nr:energy-coupling factor ABC transporter ATP-binding protein [Eremococcus coleocola]EFR31784.1 ABC transporter, ATP-binding protein [Eremococcus coleocola ACS-139-V-Col8]
MSENIIEIKDLNFHYPMSESQVLKDVSLEIKKGEWIAIIGPNGSGKSTLAKMINGLLVPDSGQIIVDGKELNAETVWDIRQAVGMVFQNPDNQFVGSTVEDDVAFGMENRGVPREEMVDRVKEALDLVRMSEFIDKEPARLSGGQKQRVAVASVIALRPQVIILDEATAMLDPKGRQEIISIVDQIKEDHDLTVISITHDINEASRADRIFILKDGHFTMQAQPAEVFALGDQLIEMGLDLPFAQKLISTLKARGVDVPDHYMDEEALLAWINQSYLNK